MVRADRLAGFRSQSVVWHRHKPGYELVRDQDFDKVMGESGTSWDDVHWLSLIHVLFHADIWVTFFDGLFFDPDQDTSNAWALSLLKLAGIRIIVQPHGNDVVYRSRFRTRYDWVRLLQIDYPSWDLTDHAEIAKRRIRLFCRYADFVIGGAWFVAPLLPRNDLLFHSVPIDCDEIKPSFCTSSVHPVIVHSPNHRNVKGTEYLIRAVDQLKSIGLDCELRLVERVPRHEALEIYKQADIIADQFCIGTIGVFGLEGMALGKPVMAYIDHAHLGDPVFNHPVVNTNPENLVRVLGVLVQIPELVECIGQAGRRSVEEHQSIPALSEVWERIYRHVWWRELLRIETTKHFSSERTTRAFTEDPSQASFWPVPVEHLIPRIHLALERVSIVDCAELVVTR